MSSVDKRIVEMSFDNAQFESGVKTTMSTLDKLKEKLQLGDSSKGLDKLSSATKSFSLDGIATGVDNISSKFSALGAIGFTILQNLTNSAIDAGKRMVSAVTTPIFSGGWERASNIENAKFTISGLGREWSDVEKQVAFAVNETAYGLDAAASAAAMLMASGVEIGEQFDENTGNIDQMGRALRAISGAAAVTNGTYEDMASIFTTVAGNGRLMGDQLMQFSYRGLNVAATMADYFNGINDGSIKTTDSVTQSVKALTNGAKVSEEQIRDFVSKGKISFDMFSTAMYDTFGEHAKRANETFTGSLANMNAALKKIGAEFAAPLMESEGRAYNMIGIFNALRQKINTVKKALVPVYEVWRDFVKIAGSFLIDTINKTDLASFFGSAAVRAKEFWEAFKQTDIATNSLRILRNVFAEIGVALTPIKNALKEFIPVPTLQQVDQFVKSIAQAVVHFRLMQRLSGDATYEKLGTVFKGLLTVVKMLVNTFKAFGQAMSPITDRLKSMASSILDFATKVANFIMDMNSYFEETGAYSKVAEAAVNAVVTVVDKLSEGVKFLIQKFEELTGIDLHFPTFDEVLKAVQKLRDEFSKLKSIVGPVFQSIGNAIRSFNLSGIFEKVANAIKKLSNVTIPLGDIFRNAAEGITNFFNSFAERNANRIERSSSVITSLGNAFQKAWHIIGIVADKIIGAGKKIAEALQNAFSSVSLDQIMASGIVLFLGQKLYNLVMNAQMWVKRLKVVLVDDVKNLAKNFSNHVLPVLETMNALKGTLVAYQRDLKASAILKIAAAVGVLALALTVLADIDSDALLKAATVVAALFAELVMAMDYLNLSVAGSNFVSVATMSTLATGMIKLAAAVLVLSIAMKSISGLNWEEIGKGLTGILGMATVLVAAAKVLSAGSTSGIIRASTGLVIFAAALVVLTNVVKQLGQINIQSLVQGLVSVGVLLAELALFLRAADLDKMGMIKGTGLLLVAAALKVLAGVVNQIGQIDTKSLVQGLLGLAAVLLEIGVFVNAISATSGANIIAQATGITILAAAILIIAQGVKSIGSLDVNTLVKGLVGMAVALAEIGVFVGVLSNVTTGNFIGKATGITILAAAILIIAQGISSIGSIDFSSMVQGLIGMGAALAEILAFMVLMNAADHTMMTATSIVMVASALAILAPVLLTLGNMSLAQVGTALLTLAGAFTVLGAAGLIFSKCGLGLAVMELSVALALIGVAVLAAGAGLLMLATALASLAISGTAAAASIVASIGIIVTGILGLMPKIIEGIGAGLVTLFQVIGNAASALIDMTVQVGSAILSAISQLVPQIGQLGIELFLALLVGLAQNMYLITVCAVTIITEFINGIADNIEPIIQSGMNLAVSFINGLANGIRDNGDRVLLAVKNLLGAMLEFGISILQELAKDIPVIGDEIVRSLEVAKQDIREEFSPQEMIQIGSNVPEGVSQGVQNGVPQVQSAAETISNTLDNNLVEHGGHGGSFAAGESHTTNFTNGALSKQGEASSAGDTIRTSFLDKLGLGNGAESFQFGGVETSEYIEGILANTSGATEAGDTISLASLQGMENNLSLFGDSGNTSSTNYLEQFLSNEGAISDAGITLPEAALSSLDSKLPEFKSSGEDAGDNYDEGFESKKSSIESTATSIADAAINKFDSAQPEFKRAGSDDGSYYDTGLDSKSTTVQTTAKTMATNAANATNVYSSFYSAGSSSGAGFQAGISAALERAKATAIAQAAAIAAAVKATLQVASPSKVFKWIGKMTGEGFIIGLKSMQDESAHTASEVGQAAIDSMSDRLTTIADVMSKEVEPTITPVLDLSQIQNGANKIDGMFANQSVGLTSANNDIFNSNRAIEQALNIENYNKNVVEEITRLRSDVSILSDYIGRLRIVLDSGALVGGLINPIDMELGRRQILAERGI